MTVTDIVVCHDPIKDCGMHRPLELVYDLIKKRRDTSAGDERKTSERLTGQKTR